MKKKKQSPRKSNSAVARPGTLAVWAGEYGLHWMNATQVPVAHSVSYGYTDLDEWLAVAKGEKTGHIYGRNTNPTVAAFEEKLRELEGAEAATSFSSGMAAISNTLFTLLSPGDHVVSVNDTYGGTNKLFIEFLPRFQIGVTLCQTNNHRAIESAIERGCSVVYLETPTNPTNKVVDLRRLCAAAHRSGSLVVVDNTFATPINQQPLKLGADLVIHSATKFLGGHADALGGIVCGGRELVSRIFHFREITGACLDPMAAYLLLRGMKTLHLRVRQQNESALKIAHFLGNHPQVECVFYPGLESHANYKIARRAELQPQRRLQDGEEILAPTALCPVGCQSRRGRNRRRPARHNQPRGIDTRGAPRSRNSRGADSLLGRHRRRERPHCRLATGAAIRRRKVNPRPQTHL
jgi:cystathionine gamma-synthase